MLSSIQYTYTLIILEHYRDFQVLGCTFRVLFLLLGRLPPHMFAFRKALGTLTKIRYLLQERSVVCGSWAVTKPTKQQKQENLDKDTPEDTLSG